MSDCSCDWCERDAVCLYSYENSFCYVETIKAARAIVDTDFQALASKIEEKNKELCDDNIDVLVRNMRYIIHCSNDPLPFQDEDTISKETPSVVDNKVHTKTYADVIRAKDNESLAQLLFEVSHSMRKPLNREQVLEKLQEEV